MTHDIRIREKGVNKKSIVSTSRPATKENISKKRDISILQGVFFLVDNGTEATAPG